VSRGPAFWLGALIGALAPAGGCLVFVTVMPTVFDSFDGEGRLEIEIGGHPTMFTPERCISGDETGWDGATLLGGGWSLDLVGTRGKPAFAFLRGPGLDRELALDSAHCTTSDLVSDYESDGEDLYQTGKLDLVCVLDQARIRGRITFRHCR
jgi:hypothetical protein